MHAWKECSCHVQKFTIEELEAVSNNNLAEEVESFLEKEHSRQCIVCGSYDLLNHHPHCPVSSGEEI